MGNVVRIEDWRELREKQEESKPEKQGVKKVSVDDGFTAIPNELLFAMGQFGFTQRQYAVLIAVIQKTLSWHKEMDWISNSQLCELTGINGEHKVSAVKNELFQMNVLIKKGRYFGINLVVSEWEKSSLPEKGNITQKGKSSLPEKGNEVYPKKVSTKETITKQKIKDNPLPPKGESAGADVEDGKGDTPSGEKQKIERTDYIGIAQAYNNALNLTGVALPRIADPSNLSDKRKRAVKKLSEVFKKRFGDGSASALGEYFTDFMRSAREFYFGENNRGWKADFDFLLRENTLDKVLEGNL